MPSSGGNFPAKLTARTWKPRTYDPAAKRLSSTATFAARALKQIDPEAAAKADVK